MNIRLTILIAGFAGAFMLLAFHMYELQLIAGGYYYARAASQNAALNFENDKRGTIYFMDKNGNQIPAALDKDFPVIYAVPKEILDAKEAVSQVSRLTGIPAASLTKKFSDHALSYALILRKADDVVVQNVLDANIKGIYTSEAWMRYYPQGSLASQLLGYVGPSSLTTQEIGHYGVEGYYDSVLGASGGASHNVVLTIDPNIQMEAERILDELAAAQHATAGSVIVEDPNTGKILAMGSYPNFDPNNYSTSSVASFLNPVTQKIYEPGSVMKVITMAAGIDAGKFTSSTTYIDTGADHIGKYTISNYDLKIHGAYGKVTMSDVIAHSINTGAVFAEHLEGNSVFQSYFGKFGFLDNTGIMLPGEVHGNFGGLGPHASPVHWATAAYGQGVAVTSLEMLNAFAAIANGGTLMRPYFDASLEPQKVRRVVSEYTASEVRAMMVNAVDSAKITAISGYAIGGKTGTAFIPDLAHGGYTDRVIDTYVGFGTGSHPQFVALVKIDNLPSTSLAALSVVPAFRELAQFIINYENFAPDRISNNNQ